MKEGADKKNGRAFERGALFVCRLLTMFWEETQATTNHSNNS